MIRPFLVSAGLVLLAGCSSPPSALLTPTGPGRDPSPVSPAVVAQAATPEALAVPDNYRLMLLDGRLVLIHDHQQAQPIQIEATGNDGPEHPELLPQEMAAEVERNRASGARMDGALKAVMDRSKDLEQEAQTLGEESRKLAQMLAAAEERMKGAEAPHPVADKPQP